MKKLLLYIVMMIGTLYVLIMYKQPSLYYVLLCEILLLFCLGGYSILIRKALHVQLIQEQTTYTRSEAIALRLVIKNRSRLPVPHYEVVLHYQNHFSPQPESFHIRGAIAGRTQTTQQIKLHSSCCGIVKINTDQLKVWDMLKLFSSSQPAKQQLSCTILPDIYPAAVAIASTTRRFPGESDTYSQTQSGDDPSEVFRIREYQVGDRPQNIHWKLTARTGELMVRENSLPLSYPVLLLLDIDSELSAETAARTMDAGVQILLSLSDSLLRQECCHYAAWYDPTIAAVCRQPVDSQDTFLELMTRLLHLTAITAVSDIQTLYERAWPYSRHCSVLKLNKALQLSLNERPVAQLNPSALEQSLAGLNLTV